MKRERIAELERLRAQARGMGGPKALERQRTKGRLNVRERIDRLFDPGSFLEIGLLADHCGLTAELKDRKVPADGVVVGWGDIEGRQCFVIGYDFTVLAGTMGRTGEEKCARIRDLALRHRRPVIWLIDSGGARVQELGGSFFATTGYLFREQVTLSGVVPQVSVVLGPGAAGTAYIPALSDVVIMVREQGTLALGGPPLVKAVLNEEVSEQELGGSAVHLARSGVAHMAADDDAGALDLVRRYLSYFPASSKEAPPLGALRCPNPVGDALLDIIPDDASTAFDMQAVIDLLVDGAETLPYMHEFGRSIITCFARIGGYPFGIVANQSMVLGGVLENDSSVKAARFVSLCDAFGIPLLFLQDVPGFLVGSRVERAGIIRHGAKMLFAVSRATVPKITIVVRKAYGAGYFVMCGRAYEPDYIAAWPTAEIALMGAEGAVNIMYGNRLAALASEEAVAERERLEATYRAEVSPERAAALFGIDDVIDPRQTPERIYRAIQLAWSRQVLRPERKHGIFPV
ncbi:MAG: acyl-CoA carboxylase subunit beta [Spirochaetales bacterium]|nr:acyl-CoA carboxylase subunit beta [Leptospiraceae bacterium]MCP5480784.1 acyl-CoA carboxylase subunit beta [Spirochaetales bacterium]